MKKEGRKTRINCRIPADLKLWAEAHAKKNDSTFTALVIGLLRDLRKNVEGTDVEQF